jgi:hypothetical protein
MVPLVDPLLAIARELLLYGVVVLAFPGPVEVFLRFRLRRASRHGDASGYLARSDPWVSAVVALAGAGTVALVSALS